MILESAEKMHEMAAKYVGSCDIDDKLAQNIIECAKQGAFYYAFQGELDDLTKHILWNKRYTIHTKRISDKIYTKIGW